jgi:hypothetical protein
MLLIDLKGCESLSQLDQRTDIMNTIKFFLTAIGCFLLAQTAIAAQPIPFDKYHWDFEAKSYQVETYKGQESLLFHKGLALVKGTEGFVNGIIEFDIAIPTKRGFSGPVWRVQDPGNYEEFYLRHHQSGNDDANQYSPVFNGLAGWQLYYSADGYGYPIKYVFDEWMPVKVIVSGSQAEIYIRDMNEPAVFVPELKRELSNGRIGLRDQGFAAAHYANFRYMMMDNPPMRGKAKTTPQLKGPPAAFAATAKKLRSGTEKAKTGTVMSWNVSNAFPAEVLAGKLLLADVDLGDRQWTPLSSDSTGLANLGRINGVKDIEKGRNCAFAKTIISAEKDMLKKFEIAFSDAVKIYLNGEIIFEANDIFRSRDYRFLGTMGYYDAVYLSLKKGENEIQVALTEKMGGWGLKARFMDMTGINF